MFTRNFGDGMLKESIRPPNGSVRQLNIQVGVSGRKLRLEI